MIRDLDATIAALLTNRAPAGSELAGADIRFDMPDSAWRQQLSGLTVNCYLYDIRENRELRTSEPLVKRSLDGLRAARVRPPVRVDCAYTITAWSVATTDRVLEEHRVLGQVLGVLLRHRQVPTSDLVGSMTAQPAPYPWIVAAPDPSRSMADFWNALDQEIKPSLNYVVTLAMWLDPIPADAALTEVVQRIEVSAMNLDEQP